MRIEGLVRAAQGVAERLDFGQDDDHHGRRRSDQINVLYRGLVLEREQNDPSLHAQKQPSINLPDYIDETMSHHDLLALGKDPPTVSCLFEQEEEDDDDDEELQAFNALDPAERLRKLIVYMREKHWYCFWCKGRYNTKDMDGCPGLTEEDHE